MKRITGFATLSALMGVSGLLAQSVPPPPPTIATLTAVAAVAATTVPAPTTPAVLVASPSEARIVNLSTRARVTGDSPLVTGFAISGTDPRTVLVRAAGPGLTGFGVAEAVAAPHLRLHDASGAVILENAGWGDSTALGAAFLQTGAFPFTPGSADAAAVVTLAPGNYSVEILDDSGRGGVALAEIYDAQGTAAGSRLVNVSARSTVAPGGGELVSGFVLAGEGNRTFLLRGIGSALAKFGVTDMLRDSALTLFNTAGVKIAANDNWSGVQSVAALAATVAATAAAVAAATAANAAVTLPSSAVLQVATGAAQSVAVANPIAIAATRVGAFGLDFGSTDAALLVTLSPGAYTVQVTGANTTSGVALLEIYEVP